MARMTWEPRSYPIRDPRSGAQQVGKIINPPRGQKLGGKGETTIIHVNTRTTFGPEGKGPVSDRGKGSKR